MTSKLSLPDLSGLEKKRQETAAELRLLQDRLGSILTNLDFGSADVRSRHPFNCPGLGTTPFDEVAAEQPLDASEDYLFKSFQSTISSLPDRNLKSKMEYLLKDYRRLSHRRHSVKTHPGDSLLEEIKEWTEEKTSAILPPIEQTTKALVSKEEHIGGNLGRLLGFHKDVTTLRQRFSAMSARLLTQLQEGADGQGFDFQALMTKVQDVASNDHIVPDSVDGLIDEVSALETLLEKQKQSLSQLFEDEIGTREKMAEAKAALAEIEAEEKTESDIDELEIGWSMSQIKLFYKLATIGDIIATQLQCQLATETRDASIANHSLNDYERLVSLERLQEESAGPEEVVDYSIEENLSISLNDTAVRNFASAILRALDESRNVCFQMSKESFDRLLCEKREFQTFREGQMDENWKADDDIIRDFKKLMCQAAQSDTSYHAFIPGLMAIILRMLNEFSRLLTVKRVRDIQMSTLTQNINIASFNAACFHVRKEACQGKRKQKHVDPVTPNKTSVRPDLPPSKVESDIIEANELGAGDRNNISEETENIERNEDTSLPSVDKLKASCVCFETGSDDGLDDDEDQPCPAELEEMIQSALTKDSEDEESAQEDDQAGGHVPATSPFAAPWGTE